MLLKKRNPLVHAVASARGLSFVFPLTSYKLVFFFALLKETPDSMSET